MAAQPSFQQGAALPDRRVPGAHGRVGEADLAALGAAEDDAGRVQGQGDLAPTLLPRSS